jgi:hypothetical protein
MSELSEVIKISQERQKTTRKLQIKQKNKAKAGRRRVSRK